MSLHRPKQRAHRARAHPEDSLTLEELSKELDTYTSDVSTQVRTIYLGVLGLSWLMLLGDEKVATLSAKLSHPFLLGISLVCLLALVLDLGQYLSGQIAVNAAYDAAVKSEKRSAGYDATSFSYNASSWCYRLKLALTLLGAAALIVLVAHALI
jgi:hypothetical protein